MAPRSVAYAFAMLSAALGASGHGGSEMESHSGESHEAQEAPETYPPTYLTLDSHRFAIRAHIGLMILSWFILLPIGACLGFSLISRIQH